MTNIKLSKHSNCQKLINPTQIIFLQKSEHMSRKSALISVKKHIHHQKISVQSGLRSQCNPNRARTARWLPPFAVLNSRASLPETPWGEILID